MIVAIEGINGVGKSTQARMLADAIGADVYEFPNYETATGKLIRKFLHDECAVREDTGHITDYDDRLALQSLMTVNRIEALPRINASILQNRNVIIVRWWPAMRVYGAIDGLDGLWLYDVSRSLINADHYVLLDASAEDIARRQVTETHRYENDSRSLARREYLKLFIDRIATRIGRQGYADRWRIVNVSKDKEETRAAVRKAVGL